MCVCSQKQSTPNKKAATELTITACFTADFGAPGTIRTCDRLVRSQVLYPAELRALWVCSQDESVARALPEKARILAKQKALCESSVVFYRILFCFIVLFYCRVKFAGISGCVQRHPGPLPASRPIRFFYSADAAFVPGAVTGCRFAPVCHSQKTGSGVV